MTDKQIPYVVGIDLGTTNSALTYSKLESTLESTESRADSRVEVLEIPQVFGPGQVGSQTTLPSFLYIPHSGELASAAAQLPWTSEGQSDSAYKANVVGKWARDRGAEVPDRVVSSAKSWLCASQADRQAALLPWRSEITEGKCSPVQASKRYLEHLGAAFVNDRKNNGENVSAADCTVVLTVPASFDEVARALTHAAARDAGLGDPVLLEEPLAAFYAWLDANDRDWRKQVQPGEVILVCDVGGGTCDFSLIAVGEDQGQLHLERISVGEHLLLGGDNMDLALAYGLKQQLEAQGRSVDHWQFLSLVAAARSAKERLLITDDLASLPIAVASRGSSLFAGTVTTELTRAQVLSTIVEGFLPRTRLDEMPKTRRSAGIQEFGLHYESDAAISRHLARFLRRSAQNVASNPQLQTLVGANLQNEALLPTAVLFNGGVFRAPALRQRIVELLSTWSGSSIKELTGADYDLAVARGATYYGKLRSTGRGIRVQSGTARSYYVGLEEVAPAVPGIEPKVRGLCLVPQGTDEGTEIELKDQQFGLVIGEPVEFRFFSSTVRAGDKPGTVVDDAAHSLDENAQLSLTLRSDGEDEGKVIPVRLDAVVNEMGMLQVYMKDTTSGRKWNLEFNLRTHEQH